MCKSDCVQGYCQDDCNTCLHGYLQGYVKSEDESMRHSGFIAAAEQMSRKIM